MTSGQIKFLTLIFALVNVWLLFHIPTVSEATLKFISVGEIPGTDKTLSPNTMLYLAIGSFVVSVLLVFWREFRKLFKRRKPAVASAPPVQAIATPVAPVPAPVAVATPPVSRRTGKRPPVVRPQVFVAPRVVTGAMATAERRTSKLFASAKAWFQKLWMRTVRTARRLATQVRALAVCFWHWLVPQSKRAWALLVQLARVARLLALDVWHWLEPRIRQFDRWLERQLHSNKTTAEALKTGGDLSVRAGVYIRKLGQLARTARDNARKAWRTTNK